MSKEIDTSLDEEQPAAPSAGLPAIHSTNSSQYPSPPYEGVPAPSSAHTQAVVRYEPVVQQGRVFLVKDVLKSLRNEKLQTQEEMAECCQQGRFRVSIASIKRAEIGRPVLFRVARELARYFNVPVERIVQMRPVTIADYLPGDGSR